MPPPTRPTILPTAGWLQKGIWRKVETRPAAREARLVVYNPDSGGDLVFAMAAVAFFRGREVRLLDGGREIGRWTVGKDEYALFTTPPFRLPGGRSELRLVSDGDDAPRHAGQELNEGDATPYSLRVSGIVLKSADPPSDRLAKEPRETR